MPRTILHVLDGTATLFRAYHASPKARDRDGREVGAVTGLFHEIARFVQRVFPTHVAIVYDPGRPTFRHEIYADYKRNRSPSPEDLVPQLDQAVECTRAIGMASFRVRGFEADDLMATLARRSQEAGITAALCSPDKDILQLLAQDVHVLDPKTYRPAQAHEVETRFGVPPQQLTDYLALAGDSSDNVPGVPGVGPKAAATLVRAFGDLEGIYANLDRVPELELRGARSVAERLETYRSAAHLSRDLVRLRTDVPLGTGPLTVGDLRFRTPDPDGVAWLRSLGLDPPVRALRAAHAAVASMPV